MYHLDAVQFDTTGKPMLPNEMARCYLCSKLIPVEERPLRRRVKIGEIEKKRYDSERARFVQSQYGMRVVCKSCVSFQDHRARQKELLDLQVIMTTFVVVCVALILSSAV